MTIDPIKREDSQEIKVGQELNNMKIQLNNMKIQLNNMKIQLNNMKIQSNKMKTQLFFNMSTYSP